MEPKPSCTLLAPAVEVSARCNVVTTVGTRQRYRRDARRRIRVGRRVLERGQPDDAALGQHCGPGGEKGWQLVRYLLRQPLWLFGWIAAVGGFAFQALALHNGPLSVVQPLLVTELVFALVLRRVWIHQDIARSAWISALVTFVALAVFLTVAEPQGGHPTPRRPNGCRRWLSSVASSRY